MTHEEAVEYASQAEGTILEGRLDQFITAMTYGPTYNRGVREYVGDALHSAKTGDEKSAEYWYSKAVIYARTSS